MKHTDSLNDFIQRDVITGKKLFNPLNKVKLTEEEMDEIFCD